MFQYAMGRSLALRNNMNLVLDPASGFARDKVFRRTFSLSDFPVVAGLSGISSQLPFWIEQVWGKLLPANFESSIRPWGRYLCERSERFQPEVASMVLATNAWIEGYWQTEHYFSCFRQHIGVELLPPVPANDHYLSLAKEIEACDSVSIGVRLFEEMPGQSKAGVGGIVPLSFYEDAACRLHEDSDSLVFYIFCTQLSLVEGKLKLPGRIVYVTHDNGFGGQNESLWLISRCKHHILSNSSFYWWGAWLAEYSGRSGKIIAADTFPNLDTIPDRWQRKAL